MVHRGDLRSGGDHLLPLLHDQGGGHVGLLGDGVGGQPPLLADLQERLVGVGVGDGVRALAELWQALLRRNRPLDRIRERARVDRRAPQVLCHDRRGSSYPSQAVESICIRIIRGPMGGALHSGGGEGAPAQLSAAPQGAVQPLLVALLLDRVSVYVQHDAD